MTDNNIEIEKKEKKNYKTFKEYYANEEFKKRHLARINEKVTCECGLKTVRCGTARHKRSKRHIRIMNEKEKENNEIKNDLKE